MTRTATPDILGVVMAGPVAEIAAALRYDYAQLGDDGPAVREHAIQIKVNERRANDAVVEAGRHLIAVKASLPHGQWEDWLQVEFHMSDRTARTMMSVAERFDGKTEMISDLSSSVLGLLASPSVPDAAVEAVIEANANGKVTVPQAKQIICQHKPAAPPRTDPPANYTVPEAVVDKPLPAWVEDPVAANDPWADALKKRHFDTLELRCERLANAMLPWALDWTDDKGRAWRDVSTRNPQHANSPFRQDVEAECKRRGIPLFEEATALTIRKLFELLNRKLFEPSQEEPTPPLAPHFDPSDDRTWELRRLETRIELIVRQLKDQEKEYGRLTGDYITAAEARHGMERMVATLRRNQGLDE